MTDANGAPSGVAPGWYADPYGAAPQRWWDGTQWTGHVSQAAVPQPAAAQAAPTQPQYPQYQQQAAAVRPARPELNPATPVGTVWIWLVALLPLLTVALLPTIQIHLPEIDLHDPTPAIPDPIGLIGGPWYFVLVGVSWLSYAALVVFSWLDYRELTRRGVVRPFHWAWSFLSSIVYVIGRTVIVRGVANRRGMAPMWGAIAVVALSFIVSTIWTITLTTSIFDQISRMAYTGA
ncbi:DUF2510 domain-containing protein [Leifsonia aquatica]|uniref:DUF2510 domain-containing protein n=1 Tax=Leifsonia aquatica TaxID=144185 RepID=UPI0028A6FEB4|nr:DUF2510 domain-containing protein [Leifsonia aquatica]